MCNHKRTYIERDGTAWCMDCKEVVKKYPLKYEKLTKAQRNIVEYWELPEAEWLRGTIH